MHNSMLGASPNAHAVPSSILVKSLMKVDPKRRQRINEIPYTAITVLSFLCMYKNLNLLNNAQQHVWFITQCTCCAFVYVCKIVHESSPGDETKN